MSRRLSFHALLGLQLMAALAAPHLLGAQAVPSTGTGAPAPATPPSAATGSTPPAPSAAAQADAPAGSSADASSPGTPSAATATPLTAAEPATAGQPTTTPAAAPSPAAAAASATPTATDATSDAARLDAVEQRVDALSRLKFSGYVQAQYVHNDTSHDGLDSTSKPLNKDLFEVRRARLRATYTQGPAEFLLNIDAIPAGVTVKEAELSVYVPWSNSVKTKVTAGLFYIPFGYEVQESDSVLPFVERTMGANRFFPGSRDVGVRVQGDLFDQHLVYQLVAVNGNPISDAVFPGTDPNASKDFVGRIGLHFGGLRFGISGLIGQGYLPPAIDDAKTTAVDETHGYANFEHRAAAFDLTFTTDLPVLGELALYAEGVVAQNLDRSKLSDYPKLALVKKGTLQVATGNLVDANQSSGYLGFTQHLGKLVALGARGELFDPNTSKSNNLLSAATFVGHVFPVDVLRLTVAYQLNLEHPSIDNNVFWLRGQVKF